MKKILVLAAAATVLFSCKKNNDQSGIFAGPDAAIQHGKGWTWVKLNQDGAPDQLGITINDAALNSMPIGNGQTNEGHTHDNSVILQLHALAKAATPFDHVELDWNPEGHPPMNIYGKPHFDFHFYMVPEAQVENAVDQTKLDAAPPAEYLPANHFSGGAVPKMGNHFVDATSPELGGVIPFTQTFIYGTYDGKVTFYEPMITLDYLKTTNSFERSIPQPARFKSAGHYPTKMSIKKHNGVTDVILGGFIKRQAS